MNPFAPPGVEEDECVADSRAVGPKLCPRCGAGIGFARVYFALGPHHVRCGACRAHLGYDELQGPGVLLLLGIAVLGGAIWWGYESIALDPLESILAVLGACVLLSVPLTAYVWGRLPLRARTSPRRRP